MGGSVGRVHELRYSLRVLRARPGFTAFVVLALGLGIGANTALFTVVNSLLLRPLPYQRPGELVEIAQTRGGLPLRELNQAQSFTGVAAFLSRNFAVASDEGVRNLYGLRVSANLFTVLGVEAALGRTFRTGEELTPVVLLSYDYWRRVSGDPKIVGQALTISNQQYTIVGVLPADFTLQVRDGNLFVPYPLLEGRVVARLRPGVRAAQAEAEVAGLLGGLDPAALRDQRARVTPISDSFRPGDVSTLLLLQAAVGMILLITCTNIASLMLARSAARRQEFALRAALGAGRIQILRQLLAESALLACLGGTVGLLGARASLTYLQLRLPANIGRALRGAEALVIDHRVLAFLAGATLVAVLLFGLAPALITWRFDGMSGLRDSARSSTPDRHGFARLLVTAEVSLAVMLLIGAGLTLKSLAGLQNLSLGFSPEQVLRAAVDLQPSSHPEPEQQLAALAEMVRRLEVLPAVETVGVLAPQFFPFGGPRVRGAGFEILGRPGAEPRAEVYVASPEYFRSVRIPLLQGRLFTGGDTAVAAPVALISDIVAKRYWGMQNPLGARVRFEPDRPGSPWISIVGVVGDVRNPVGAGAQPTAYRPLAQRPVSGGILLIRARADPMALVAAVRRELRAVDPAGPEARIAGLEKAVADYITPQRFTTSVLGFFAALGLLLAALGVYGVTRCWVVARIPEIGIRVALGAQRRDVLLLVLGKAGRAAGLGVVLGIGGALALHRVMTSQLHGVSATDPVVFTGASLLMGAVALVAAFLPARWAAGLDPLAALRHE